MICHPKRVLLVTRPRYKPKVFNVPSLRCEYRLTRYFVAMRFFSPPTEKANTAEIILNHRRKYSYCACSSEASVFLNFYLDNDNDKKLESIRTQLKDNSIHDTYDDQNKMLFGNIYNTLTIG